MVEIIGKECVIAGSQQYLEKIPRSPQSLSKFSFIFSRR